MKTTIILVLQFISFFLFAQKSDNYLYPNSKLDEVAFHEIQINDQFWTPRIKLISEVTLPYVWELAKKQGRIENFKIVAGLSHKKYFMRNSPDAPMYKLVEAAGYAFHQFKNPKFEAEIDSFIDLVGLIQDKNGYVHTQFMLAADDPSAPSPQSKDVKTFGFGRQNQWKGSAENSTFAYSQLFTAGHMFEAAVAYYRGTGKRKLLDISIKFADDLMRVFNNDEFIKNYDDHPEIQIGLMKLYEVTGKKEYLELADKFSRYLKFSRPVDIGNNENQLPLQDQCDAYGHCVRTAYIYTGTTEVIRATGATDLHTAINALWNSVTGRKMYIHGGTGNGTPAEQHGKDYDLPIYSTYSECCANIANGQWNHSLNLLTGNAEYADLVEHIMYNSGLSGLSQDGKKFFYSNLLNVGLYNRTDQHDGVRESYLFCCPSKLPIFITGISRWIYAKNNKGIYVNQYIGSSVKTNIDGNNIDFSLNTDYPWKESAILTVNSNSKTEYAYCLRIPYWERGGAPFNGGLYYFSKSASRNKFTIRVNGEELTCKMENGYAIVKNKWKKGDQIEITFTMPVNRIYTSSKVKYNAGRVALSRGPVLFCLEGIDNPFDVQQFVLPKDSIVKATFNHDLFGGAIELTGKGFEGNKQVEFKAIPYFLWENRGIYKMSTLLIEEPAKICNEKEVKDKAVPNTNG